MGDDDYCMTERKSISSIIRLNLRIISGYEFQKSADILAAKLSVVGNLLVLLCGWKYVGGNMLNEQFALAGPTHEINDTFEI